MKEIVKSLKIEFFMSKGLLKRAGLFFLLFLCGSFLLIPDIIYVWGILIVTAMLDMRYECMDRCSHNLLINSLPIKKESIFLTKIVSNVICTVLAISMSTIVYFLSSHFKLFIFDISIISYFNSMWDALILMVCISWIISTLEIYIFMDIDYNKASMIQIMLLMIISFVAYGLYNSDVIGIFDEYFSAGKNIIIISITILLIITLSWIKIIKIRKNE